MACALDLYGSARAVWPWEMWNFCVCRILASISLTSRLKGKHNAPTNNTAREAAAAAAGPRILMSWASLHGNSATTTVVVAYLPLKSHQSLATKARDSIPIHRSIGLLTAIFPTLNETPPTPSLLAWAISVYVTFLACFLRFLSNRSVYLQGYRKQESLYRADSIPYKCH